MKNYITKVYNNIINKKNIIPIDKACEIFDNVFEEIRKDSWFVFNAEKQHLLLKHSLTELK
jgi:hypothetical protein